MSISTANYKIKQNGTDFPADLFSAVEGVYVEDEINLPTMFSIKLNMCDRNNGKWRGIDLKTFKPGDKISVLIGLDKLEPVVSGEITSLELNFCKHDVLEIRGYDLMHRLRMGTRNKVFTKKKDSEIASEIAREHGLAPTVEDTKTVYPYIFQNNQSDLDFLLERAAMLDYEIYVEDKKFYFVKSRSQKDSSLPELVYRNDFDELNLELKTLTRGSEVEVRGWNVKDKKEFGADSKKGDETTKMGGQQSGFELISNNVEESPIAISLDNMIDINEAKSVAIGTYNRLLREFISGEGKCFGNPLLKAGKTVKLKGIGERFSGTYYIVSTSHKIDNTGYTTIFKVRRCGI